MREYNRIHQIIHGLIRDEGDAERGCTFFSIVGSYLLNKHYGIKLGVTSRFVRQTTIWRT